MPDDSIDEILDVLADDGTVVGTASRREVHTRGLWHRTFHGLVIRPGDPGGVIFQRRATSAWYAGRLDFTASGHLEAGETPRDGVRELEEEVGLVVSADDLTAVGVHRIIDDRGSVVNREQVHVFFVASDRPLEEFDPDPGEVAALVEVEPARVLALVDPADGTDRIPATEWRPGSPARQVTLTYDDFTPGYDNYLIKTMIMAERFATGRTPIAI